MLFAVWIVIEFSITLVSRYIRIFFQRMLHFFGTLNVDNKVNTFVLTFSMIFFWFTSFKSIQFELLSVQLCWFVWNTWFRYSNTNYTELFPFTTTTYTWQRPQKPFQYAEASIGSKIKFLRTIHIIENVEETHKKKSAKLNRCVASTPQCLRRWHNAKYNLQFG